ncbi:MAG: signal peptidase I [Lachnospiraceae bacterium]|jgi:signal peptidase I
MENKEEFSAKKIIIEVILYIALILVCIFIIPRYVVQRTKVVGSSMENTLHQDDNLLVEKVTYKFKNPDRFDIIVFYPYGKEEDPDDYYVKRIIGLPGETVQIIGADIYINGEILEEHYGKDPITDPGVAREKITLGENEFFVLGDNREVSEDSRVFGAVDKKNISGQVVFRIYPFNKFGPMTSK